MTINVKNVAVDIKNVGVIGAGQMGNGIAHVCALAGYSVMLNDLSPDRIKAGDGDHQRQHGQAGRQEGDQRRGPQERALAHQAGGEIRRARRLAIW